MYIMIPSIFPCKICNLNPVFLIFVDEIAVIINRIYFISNCHRERNSTATTTISAFTSRRITSKFCITTIIASHIFKLYTPPIKSLPPCSWCFVILFVFDTYMLYDV